MIHRPFYMETLKKYRDVPLVKILAGIRRSGKSTILEMLQMDLQESRLNVTKENWNGSAKRKY